MLYKNALNDVLGSDRALVELGSNIKLLVAKAPHCLGSNRTVTF